MKKKQSPTIVEVARAAEVSPMTVSRVINGNDNVKSSTRERVNEAIRKLNYRPNLMARKLAGKSGFFVGLVYSNPSYSYLSEFLLGALTECRSGGHHLVVEEPLIQDDLINLEYIEQKFRDTSIQAVIIVPPLSEDRNLLKLVSTIGIPFVTVGPSPESGIRGVIMDDEAAAYEMTQYLIQLGHRDIAFIRGPDDHRSSEFRFAGFQRAMRESKLIYENDWIRQGEFTHSSGMAAANSILTAESKPSAIFAANDDMALGVIAAAQKHELNVPSDLSVVGFDDTPHAAEMWPPLTTVRQPIRQMARAAVKIIDQHLNGIEAESAPMLLDYEIVQRDSCKSLTRATTRAV